MDASRILFPGRETIENIFIQLEKRHARFDRDRILYLLNIMGMIGSLQKNVGKHFGRYDLSQARFVVLLLLLNRSKDQNWTAISLARELEVSKPTITGLLTKLERDGLVERLNNPDDKRSRICVLTEKGKRTLDQILPDHFSRLSKALSPIPKKDLKTLTMLISSVSANAI